MFFKEYETSCKRHMRACDSLLENLPNYPIDKQVQILHEVYYLSGYIFECIYKFAFFILINYPDNNPVDDDVLKFHKIKTHKFSILRDRLDSKTTSDIPFIKNENAIEKDILDLYKQWDPKFRYEVNPLVSEERVRRLLYWAKKTRKEILNHI